ncbi:MAG: pyridoxine 5'-phosphate synthase [Myxococcales bacterium]|nr:pyridoxine 5'-phosphate synthase [Myxococcales bacterium]
MDGRGARFDQAELAGVDCLSYDLRAVPRAEAHRDVRLLRETISGRLDLALAPSPDLLDVAFDLRPDRLTLVPERREGGAAIGGLDAQMLRDALRKQVVHLHDADLEVAVRIEPELEQVKALHRSEVDVAVLNAGTYLQARGGAARRLERSRLADAAALAARLKLRVAVAGDLDLAAVEALAREPHVTEFHLGHAGIARALLRGMDRAVADFAAAIERGRRGAFA